jgi:gamma-glutamyltranspeptidase/glutathione hydrolase
MLVKIVPSRQSIRKPAAPRQRRTKGLLRKGFACLIAALLACPPVSAQNLPDPATDIVRLTGTIKPVVAQRGMVTTQDAAATRIGVAILERGGNAVDAAVAVGFALAVTHPRAGNLGGGGFFVIWLAEKKQAVAASRTRQSRSVPASASACRAAYRDLRPRWKNSAPESSRLPN